MSVDAVVVLNNTKEHKNKAPWKKGDPFLDISLDPEIPKALKGTFQETLYIQQLKNGELTFHTLYKNEVTHKYEIINPKGQIVPSHKTAHIYSFVVLQQKDGSLALRLGLGNHYFTSGRANTVKAAGDIHLWKADITKITNQSGGYHIENNKDISNSAYAAMEAVSLPMEKFVAFSDAKAPVIFSTKVNSLNAKLQSPRPYTAPKPQAR